MSSSSLYLNDVNLFRDYQTRSTILAERERAVEARRLVVQELRHAISTLQNENLQRREKIQAECSLYATKKAAQDEKINAREAQIRAAQDRLLCIQGEEQKLKKSLSDTEEKIHQCEEELQKRINLISATKTVGESVRQLRKVVEERDALLLQLEGSIETAAAQAMKRHSTLKEVMEDADNSLKAFLDGVSRANEDEEKNKAHSLLESISRVNLSQLEDLDAAVGRRTSSTGVADLGSESLLLVDDEAGM